METKAKSEEKKEAKKVYSEWLKPKKVNGVWRLVPAKRPY